LRTEDKKTILISVGVAVAIVIAILAFLRAGTGSNGKQGISERGLPGENGLSGENGSQGIQGPAGATGPQGPQGATGAIGPQGPAGATGPQGATGPAGASGENGITPQLEYNNENNMIRWVYDNGTVTDWIVLPQGEQGPAGATGPQGPQGEQGPAGENGNDANLSADVSGLLSYYPNCLILYGPAQSGTGVGQPGYGKNWQCVVGFLVNFGTENAENVKIHMVWENATYNLGWENTIYVGHLNGHGLYSISWETYVPGSDTVTFNWSYEITWN
jgi:hypothetical protein